MTVAFPIHHVDKVALRLLGSTIKVCRLEVDVKFDRSFDTATSNLCLQIPLVELREAVPNSV